MVYECSFLTKAFFDFLTANPDYSEPHSMGIHLRSEYNLKNSSAVDLCFGGIRYTHFTEVVKARGDRKEKKAERAHTIF